MGMVATVFVFGTLGYWAFGLSLLDSAYQTITTITTVGYRELAVFGPAEKLFTMVLIVLGVSTALYTFTLAVQVVVEGQLREFVGRRRMDRELSSDGFSDNKPTSPNQRVNYPCVVSRHKIFP